MKAHDQDEALPAPTRAKVDKGAVKLPDAIRETKREENRQNLDSIAGKKAKAVKGVYDVIVVDPPWPMQKFERDCRPKRYGTWLRPNSSSGYASAWRPRTTAWR